VGILAVLCHELLLTVFVVQGVSMEPTLLPGQRVVVLRAGVQLSRGDLVVFKNPIHPRETLLKRVIGLPGEEIRSEQGRVYVGSFEVAEEGYLKPGAPVTPFPSTRLRGGFFLMGDNRAESIDSRQMGEIDQRLILGKVVFTLW
jgi:signal peptidase I